MMQEQGSMCDAKVGTSGGRSRQKSGPSAVLEVCLEPYYLA